MLAIAAALLCSGCGGGGALDADALSNQGEALQSVAAEGALLGKNAGAGKTTRIFAREHAAELSQSASKDEESLRSATADAELRPELRRLTVLAGRTSDALDQLGDASEAEQRRLAAELQRAADRIEEVVKGL